MRSVVRFSDQAAGRVPERCVLTGVRTEHLLRVRAVSDLVPELLADAVGGPLRLGRAVDLPIAPEALRAYRKAQSRWVGVLGAAMGLGVVGVASGALPWVGMLLLVVAVVGSARLRHQRWIQVRQPRDGVVVVVLRAHPDFDREAQRLFAEGVRRGEP